MNPLENTGTLNPEALILPTLRKKSINTSYDKMAKLSQKLENLRAENEALEKKLKEMVEVDSATNPFCQFQKWYFEFQQRLIDREAELNAFADYISSFRSKPDPTFVEVDASRVRKPKFDAISLSLLVSNPERKFFLKEDLLKQNEDLELLIMQQREALNLLNARLKLFTKYQNAATVTTTLEALKHGETPNQLAGAAPTRSIELKTKKKLLSEELSKLVDERKAIMKIKVEAKFRKRYELMRQKKATLIQSYVRGFLARLFVKRLHSCATKIQAVWRGYLVRYQQKQAMADFDDQLDQFEHPTDRKRRKRTVIVVNEYGEEEEEEEYYEEEEEEEGKYEDADHNETDEEINKNEGEEEAEGNGEEEVYEEADGEEATAE